MSASPLRLRERDRTIVALEADLGELNTQSREDFLFRPVRDGEDDVGTLVGFRVLLQRRRDRNCRPLIPAGGPGLARLPALLVVAGGPVAVTG